MSNNLFKNKQAKSESKFDVIANANVMINLYVSMTAIVIRSRRLSYV